MNLTEIKQTLKGTEYDFLRENPSLGNNIILVGLGGSHAYGTNIEGSDLDIRGIAHNSKCEILLGGDFEQVADPITDTVIYSLNKIVKLLINCNPNTIEMLGLLPEQYIYLSSVGEELVKNKDMFLSQRAVNSFGGYANQQLYRLSQKSKHALAQAELEKHIHRTLESMMIDFHGRYTPFDDDSLKIYTDTTTREGYDTELYFDINLHHYPVRDWVGMFAEMQTCVRSYNKIGKRNSKAIEHGKIAKHMMHLVRLYLMCFDILEKGEINTYRSVEHDYLMEIRNGKYIDDNNQVVPEFFKIVDELEERLEYDKVHTILPEQPDMARINEFVMNANERVIKGTI